MNNPWNVSDAFDDMFVDHIVLSSHSMQLSCDACVFPVEDVDPFTESTTTNSAKMLNVLVRYRDVNMLSSFGRPKISDCVLYDGVKWSVADVDKEQDWYRITTRSKA